jgi:cell division protease FtsH
MVCNWGMSEELGPVTFGKREEHIFLGREFAQAKDFSEETARLIDSAIKNLVLGASDHAVELLRTHRAQLQALAQALLATETLDSAEIDKILASFQEPPTDTEPQDSAVDLSLSLQQA